jgi:putative Ca2+/H+ antiporter (TMEM165/GDT1 family)
MEAFLISITSIAVAEIGDRTQLLSLVLAARYRRPLPIIAGILCATLANHAAAGFVGIWFGSLL